MEQSLYFEYVKKYFPQLVVSIVEKLNEKNRTQMPYMYKGLLDTEYSADARWSSILADYSRVAADVVSLDSELPLKARDVITTQTGDIPKLGLKLYLQEKEMKDIQSMIANNLPTNQIVRKIFADTSRVIDGVYERIEDIFLSELSTGVGLSTRNNGTGVRIDVGYYDANKFASAVPWEGNVETSTPLDDMQAVFDKALDDDNVITDIYADDTWLRGFYRSQQARAQFAFDSGVTAVNNSVPVLDFNKATQVVQTKWGVNLHRVARKIKTEVNGVKQYHNPWAKGVAVFACDEKLGKLVWTDTVESTRPVDNVSYQTADEYILVSKYSKNDPWREFTASQAMVVPIVNNVDRIYLHNSTQTKG